jgi:methyl-accepting chemotaxis protein
MTVRTFFLACLAAAAGVALLAALVTVATEWRRFADAGRARQAAIAIGAALDAAEALSLEAGVQNRHLMADGAADDAATAALGRARSVTDGALATARARAADAALGATLARDGATLAELRSAADGALRQPRSARGFDRLQALSAGFDDLPAHLDPALDPIERTLSALDSAAASAIWVARRAAAMRALAGRRARFYLSAIAVREPIEEDGLERMAGLAGRIDQLGREVRAAVVRVGDPPRLVAALDTMAGRFERDLQQLDAPLDAAARGGGVYPLGIDQYLEQATPLIQSVLVIRDAAIAEALDHARGARAAALLRLGLSLGLVVLVTAVIVAVGMLFARRVVGPLAALTGVVTRLADGVRDLDVPGRARRDEIGRMAQAIELLRLNSIKAAELGRAVAAQRAAEAAHARRIEEITTSFDADSDALIQSVLAAARSVGAEADKTVGIARTISQQSDAAARISADASADVQTVAAAAEQLARSVQTIAGRVEHSSRIAARAVAEARSADQRIAGLATASDKIGEVVKLISDIASQTNPAGPQRDDRGGARRRRRQGLRGGRDRSQEPGRTDRARHRGHRRPDRPDPAGDPRHHREPARDRRHDHRDECDLGRDRRRGRPAAQHDRRDRRQRPARRGGHAAGLRPHRLGVRCDGRRHRHGRPDGAVGLLALGPGAPADRPDRAPARRDPRRRRGAGAPGLAGAIPRRAAARRRAAWPTPRPRRGWRTRRGPWPGRDG